MKRIHHLGVRAIEQWGENAQIVKAIEELCELSTVLCKRLNGSPVTLEQIVDEIADVTIVTRQMKYLFHAELVDQRIDYKLDRLEKALDAWDERKKSLVPDTPDENPFG